MALATARLLTPKRIVQAAPRTLDFDFTRNSLAYTSDGKIANLEVPRFEPGRFGQAVLVDEGTTNLVLNPSFENDLTNWDNWGSPPTKEIVTTQKLYGAKALHLITNGNNQGVYQIFTVSLNVPYTLSVWVKVITGQPVIMALCDGIYLTAVAPAEWAGDGQWHRLTLTFTAFTTTSIRIYLGISADGAVGEYYFDGVQLEQNPYATSFVNGTRSPETLTIPTAGVLNKGNWTKEFYFIPTFAQVVTGKTGYLWECYIDANNYYALKVGPDGKPYLEIKSNGTVCQTATTSAPALAVGTPYAFAIRGNGSLMALFVNGGKISEVSYVEPVGTLPANQYLGCDHNGANHANGKFDDYRDSSCARTDEEIAAAYQSGQPLPIDQYTTKKLSFDM